MTGSAAGQAAQELREVVAIGRRVEQVGVAAGAPRRVPRERRVARKRAAQADERKRLMHHHAECSIAGAPTRSSPRPS